MNVFYLVYTTNRNGKQYWIQVTDTTAAHNNYLANNNAITFNGTNQYISGSTPISLPADFTIEAWIKPVSFGSQGAMLVAQWVGGTATQCCFIFQMGTTGLLGLNYGIGSLNSGVAGTTQHVVLNQWNHVAMTRQGSTIRFFVNGVMDATTPTVSGALNASPVGPMVGFFQGSAFGAAQAYFNGSMSNVRIVAGTALYTTNFTPSTSPLTAVTGTMFLTAQSSTFKDNSANKYTVTATNAPTISATGPFTTAPSTDTVSFSFKNGTNWVPMLPTDPNYPVVSPAQSAQASYTPDGQYFVMATSKGILGYQQVGASVNACTFPVQAAGLLDAKITSDSNYVIGVNNLPPYAVCYKRTSATAYSAIGNLSSVHNAAVTCLDCSVGGNYTAMGGNTLYLYKKVASNFSALTFQGTDPGIVNCLRFSADSLTLYVGTANGLFAATRSGDTFTVPATPIITGNILGIDLSSTYIAIGTDAAVAVYNMASGSPVQVSTQAKTNVKSVRFSTDGHHISFEHTSAPYYEVSTWQ